LLNRNIIERAQGNPFFLEELVNAIAERGDFEGERGAYRLKGRIDAVLLPATVQAVVAARIDHLEEMAKQVLETASVIGRLVAMTILEPVAALPHEELFEAISRLRQAELLYDLPPYDQGLLAFRHPLIQEVAYSAQLRVRRGILHSAVGHAIERFYPERLNELAALLSYHFEEAGETQAAAEYAARAARWVGSTSPAQAIKHWHKVRVLKAGQPRTPDNDALKITASSQIAWLGWREGMTSEDARPFIQEAVEWARDIDDSMIPLLLFVEGRIAGASGGQADAYVKIVKEALALAESRRDAGRAATLSASLSQAYGWAGLLREALAANDVALAGVSSIADFDHQFLGYSIEHWILSLRGRILVRLGRFDEARRCFDQILAIEPALIDPTVRFIANLGYVDLAWCLDDPKMANEHAGQVADLATRQGSPYLRAYSSVLAGLFICLQDC
jgi:adenylate cyclase